MPRGAYGSSGSLYAFRFFGNVRIGPSCTGGDPGAPEEMLPVTSADLFDVVAGIGTPGAIACALANVLLFAFGLVLRVFVESNPVAPAPEAGGVKLGGAVSCSIVARLNF